MGQKTFSVFSVFSVFQGEIVKIARSLRSRAYCLTFKQNQENSVIIYALN
jgi:hypothetical protein